MINNEPVDQPHVYPPADREIETPHKTFLPILFIIVVACYSFTYNPATDVVTVTVTTIQISNYIISSYNYIASFTFNFGAVVTNPSREVFSYSSTSADVLYASQEVGSMFIPGRCVAAGMENEMEVSINVKLVPVSVVWYVPAKFGMGKSRPAMELELRMKLVGRRTVLWFFSRQVVYLVERRVAIDVIDGSLLALPFSA